MKWFRKKERQVPEDAVCRNCGAQMQGRYCHECGQDIFAGTGIPILQLIGQLLDNAFALEGKTPRTLVNLLFRPGFLSCEYMNGKVVRYVNPVKLFWMSTIIFFALLISQLNPSNWLTNENINLKFNGVELNNSNVPISDSIAFDSKDMADKEETAKWLKNEKNREIISKIFDNFSKFAPYVAFLLIPFFALLLALFYWCKRYYYVHHLIFTVHFHAFLWIFCSLLLLVKMFINSRFSGWLSTTLFFTPGIYLIFALHRFYHPQTYHFKSWRQTIWKSIFITLLYFFIFCILTVIITGIVLKIYFPELAT